MYAFSIEIIEAINSLNTMLNGYTVAEYEEGASYPWVIREASRSVHFATFADAKLYCEQL